MKPSVVVGLLTLTLGIVATAHDQAPAAGNGSILRKRNGGIPAAPNDWPPPHLKEAEDKKKQEEDAKKKQEEEDAKKKLVEEDAKKEEPQKQGGIPKAPAAIAEQQAEAKKEPKKEEPKEEPKKEEPKKEEPKKEEPKKEEPKQQGGIPKAPAAIDDKQAEAKKEELKEEPKKEEPKKEEPSREKIPAAAADDIIPEDEDEETTKAKALEEMPPSLTLANFDNVVSERLSLVEFFSPYCGHCKVLAPIWEKAFKEFTPEMKKLNVQMRQVNCVENGDLCEREDIDFYPNIRLYSPLKDPETKQIIPGKHKNVESFPRTLKKTPDNFKRYLKNAFAEYNDGSVDLPPSSELLTTDKILQIATGEIDDPVFVAFFPSSDLQWQNSEKKSTKDDFSRQCYDCKSLSQKWNKLSNQVLSTVKTAHVNCLSNPVACNSLGFNKLTRSDNPGVAPKFVMFLPKATGIIRVDYEQEISMPQMKLFCAKIVENSKYDTITARSVTEVLDVKKSLPFEPLNSYYPLSNTMLLIFFHSDKDISAEDRSILPHILEYIIHLPFNIRLYLSSDKKLLETLSHQSKNMVEYINYDQSIKDGKYQYSVPLFLSNTLTTLPTLLLFKENSLFTPIFQNFAMEDMRFPSKIKDFIERNQFPLYQELTPSLLETYFPQKEKTPHNVDAIETDINDKVVVTFIDANDATLTGTQLFNLSLAAHEYNHLKKEYYFNDLLSKREDKQNTVDKLLKQNVNSLEVVAAMKKDIPHFFNNDEVLFTFIDVSINPDLANRLGWDTTGANYKVGDAIIVSKNDYRYWNKDITGTKQLTNDPYELAPVLQYLLDPKLVDQSKKPYVSSLLIGSPYPNALRFMDVVHRRGFLGYILLWIVLYAAYYGYKKLRRRKHTRLPKSPTGLGILGKKD